MQRIVDVDATAHPNTDMHTIVLKLWADPSGERDFVLSVTQAVALGLALEDALEEVHERT